MTIPITALIARTIVMARTALVAICVIGVFPLAAEPEGKSPQTDCQSCTARHQSLKRLQKTPSDVPRTPQDATNDAVKEVSDIDGSAAGENVMKSEGVAD